MAKTGFITYATINEAIKVQISVIGKNFINSPTIPGQNKSGTKGIIVVTVPDKTGTKTSDAANLTASMIEICRYLLKIRWEFSITTIASSTTIPSPNRKAKSTMVFKVNPKKYSGINAKRADRGTDNPTKIASLTPIKNIKTNTTKMKPKITVLTKSSISVLVLSDESAVIFTFNPSGKVLSFAFLIIF